MSQQLSPDEINALSEKVEAFAASLSNRERDAFAAALWNGEDGGEVEGFAFKSPIAVNFVDLKFTNGASKVAFPSVGYRGATAPKGEPSPWPAK